jgi:hypothetical protein
MGRTLLFKYSFVINYNYIIIIEKTKRVDATTISKSQNTKDCNSNLLFFLDQLIFFLIFLFRIKLTWK